MKKKAKKPQKIHFYHSLAYILFSFAISHACNATETKLENTTTIKLYNQSFTEPLRDLLYEVVEQSLSLTQKEFGNYSIELYPQRLSYARIKNEAANGENIHIFNIAHTKEQEDEESLESIDISFISQLLGLRMLTINTDENEKFSDVRSAKKLRQFTAGLGYRWEDTKVFEYHKLPYEGAILSSALIPMLKAKRFDYLSYSILENISNSDKKDYEGLSRLNHIFIYYPISMKMNISKKHPQLAERMKEGLKRYIDSGRAKELIHRKMQAVSALTEEGEKYVLVFNNPIYSNEFNKQYIDAFTEDLDDRYVVRFYP